MWRNFRCLPMTDVDNSDILHIWHVCDVKNVDIYAKFMQFSCGEKLSPKVHLWRKNDKYEVWFENQRKTNKHSLQHTFVWECMSVG